MRKVYLITDTHLKHTKVATYCQRPENFTDMTHKNIMDTVKPEDILLHLGDIGIDKAEGPEGFMKYVRIWPGTKWLVLGNHDHKSALWYTEHGFHFAADGILFRGVWFTHKPANALPEGANINIHGHLHNVWDGFGKDDPEAGNSEFHDAFRLQRLKYPWQRLLSLEYTNYMPVEMDKFVAKGHRLYQSTGPNQETKDKNEARGWLRQAVESCFDVDPDVKGLIDGI
ncbi:Uncharacterised protein [uncultured archaeon]|nr:Uncharacterised protein [uncultured archaeon]